MIKLPTFAFRDPARTASLIKRRWREGETPDAVEALRQHPEIASRHSLVLEIALEDYCLRKEAGEAIDSVAFCDQFTDIRRSLARQIEVYAWVTEHAHQTEAASWPEAGDLIFGKYLVQEELGRGSLARAYLCEHIGLHRQVVVKVASCGEYEARTLARFDNDTIMPVLDVTTDTSTGRSGICMPFLGRSTLHSLLDEAWKGDDLPQNSDVILAAATRDKKATDVIAAKRNMPLHVRTYVDGVRVLAQDITDALSHAHQAQVTHGDLKPSNVLLTPEGRAVLMDFNLSNDASASGALTGGTLPYMSPEQLRALLLRQGAVEDIGPRSDVFSLGVILFELLSGQLPFATPLESLNQPEQIAEALLAAQRRGPPDLCQLNPQVGLNLARLISDCLRFDVAERPAKLPVWITPHSATVPPGTETRSQQFRWWALALVLPIMLSAMSAPFFITTPPTPPPNRANSAKVAELVDQRQWRSAINALKVLPPQAQTAEVCALLGFCYQCISESDRIYQGLAEEQYRRALAQGFRTPGLLNNMGVSRSRRGSRLEALAWFDLALRDAPQPQVTKSNRLFAVFDDAINCEDFYPEAYRLDAEQLVQEQPGFRNLELRAAVLTTRCAHFDPTLCERAVELWLLAAAHGEIAYAHAISKLPLFDVIRDDPRLNHILEHGDGPPHSSGISPVFPCLLHPLTSDLAWP